MKSARIASLLIVLAAACSASVRPNEFGLRVVGDEATYARHVGREPGTKLVELTTAVPGIALDIRYATENNFMKRALYTEPAAFLRAPAARALAAVQDELRGQGLGLKVYDAYRPYSVTKAMWESIRNADYVADPAKGSRHNRGCAVDVTLIRLSDGMELPMPTPYDDFTPRARHDFAGLPAEVIANRRLLRESMERHGFVAFESEWWHYDFKGWETYELMDLGFQALR
ncbi:MAG: M15 family metallopeptidase [Acidobacteria bacterium]|nr:M15 family metallopeptidase [Acidobacteriota bacterium]